MSTDKRKLLEAIVTNIMIAHRCGINYIFLQHEEDLVAKTVFNVSYFSSERVISRSWGNESLVCSY